MHQHQHPPGRQMGGGRIYYGSYFGRGDQCKKCLLVLFTVLFLLIGFIVTIVGNTMTPFWSERDASSCSFCAEGRSTTLRNAANCRIVGPIFIGIGVLLLIFTIYYFKKKKSEAASASGGTYSIPAQTTTTYNQANASVSTPYPGPGQMQPSCPQPAYPLAPSAPYPASEPYPSATQPYPTGPQQYQPPPPGPPYPPTQQPYPGTSFPPPPSYNEVVAGTGGPGEKKQ